LPGSNTSTQLKKKEYVAKVTGDVGHGRSLWNELGNTKDMRFGT